MARFVETLERARAAPLRDPSLSAIELSRSLVERARRCDGSPAALDELAHEASLLRHVTIPSGDRARLALWLNVYNALSRHAILAYEARGNLLSHRAIFERAAYTIAGHRCSLDDIEHGILRRNARKPLSISRPFAADDPRAGWAPAERDPRIHFALNCGAKSCPPIRTYGEDTVDRELRLVSRDYFATECVIDRQRMRVELPFLMLMYAGDFAGRDGRVAYALPHLAKDDALWLLANLPRVKIRYASYDWTVVR